MNVARGQHVDHTGIVGIWRVTTSAIVTQDFKMAKTVKVAKMWMNVRNWNQPAMMWVLLASTTWEALNACVPQAIKALIRLTVKTQMSA